MMKNKLLRGIALAVIWAGAAEAAYLWCIVPYRCNLAMRIVSAQTENLAAAGPMAASSRARRNLELLKGCFDADCPNPELAMLLADNNRILGLPGQAITILNKELRYEQRPEIYCLLGLSLLEAGREQEGIENLTRSVIYNPTYMDRISVHHDKIRHLLDLYQLHILELKKKAR